MESIRGASRGESVVFDEKMMKLFEDAESKTYQYKVVPKRLLATMDIMGNPTPERIGEKVKELKKGTVIEILPLFPFFIFLLFHPYP